MAIHKTLDHTSLPWVNIHLALLRGVQIPITSATTCLTYTVLQGGDTNYISQTAKLLFWNIFRITSCRSHVLKDENGFDFVCLWN